MARLPSKFDLSGPVSLRSGRQIATYDTTAIGRGIQQLGAGIGDLASSMVAKQEQDRQQQNAVDIATAEAHKTQSLLDIQNRAENDPDYAKLPEKYGKEIEDATKQATDVIRDPKMRERYAATQLEGIARARDFITDISTKKAKDANVSALDDANKKNYNLVIDPNTPEDIRDKARADISAAIDTAEKTGLLAPDDASRRRDLFVQKSYDEQALLAAQSGKLNLPNIDALTNAVVGVESGANSNAESNKGALGLMQVMPDTAAQIAKEIGDTNFPSDPAKQKEYLKNPDVSMLYGKKYLSDMLARYNGDEEAALIAYNGGPTRADAWLKAGRDDSVLPDETAKYYRKVLGAAEPQTKFDVQQVANARSFLQSRTDKGPESIKGLNDNFAVKLANLIQAAPEGIRDKLGVFSAYRSAAHQAELFSAAVKKYGSPEAARKWVAPPGKSNHNAGLAADMSFNGTSLKYAPPEVVSWVHDNAEKYGLKFPLSNENWHVEDSSTRHGVPKQFPKDWEKVSPDVRQRVIMVSEAQQKEVATQQLASLKATQQQAKDDFSLQIAVDPNRVTQSDILGNQYLDNGDKASLINTLNSALKEDKGVNEFIQALSSGQSLSINNYDKDQTKIADKAFDKLIAAAPEDQRPLVTSSFIAQTGRIPPSLQAEIRRGMTTQSIPEMAATLQTVDKLDQISPTAINTMPGADLVQKNLTAYRHFAFDMGYSAEEAARKVVSLNDPALASQREAIMKSKPISDFIKQVDSSTVAGIFDSMFSFAPRLGDVPSQQSLSIGYTPESEQAIVADYKGILEESIADAGGDTTLGKKLADERFAKMYGTSMLTIAGDKAVVKLPPERAYPPDANGSYDYIKQQAIDDLKAEKIDATDVFLQPYDQTERDVSAGKPANYQLFYMQDGKLQKYQHPFTADPAKANATAIENSKAKQKTNLNFELDIQKRMDEAKKRKEGSPDFMKALEMQNEFQKMQDEKRTGVNPDASAPQDNSVTPDDGSWRGSESPL